MALVIADRVRETSSTTGTGTLTLDGAVTGFQSFSAAIGNTNTCYYAIINGADFEIGIGTVGAGTLARTTVLQSTNADALVNFSAGIKDVFVTYPAEKSVNYNEADNVVIAANTTTAALTVTQTGTGNAFVVEDSTSPDSSPFVVDTNGAVVLGATVPYVTNAQGSSYTPRLQNNQSGASSAASMTALWSNVVSGAYFMLAKSRGAVGTHTVVLNGDATGNISFAGSDGTSFIESARIRAEVDGTPGTNDMPGRLLFSTTADGASSPTERMRIDSAGNVGIGKTPTTALDVNGTVTATSFAGGGTFSGAVLNDGYTEEVFAVTGTTPALSPTNGSIQTWTLTANSTPTAGTWANGQSLTLQIDDGTAFTVNWATLGVVWKTDAGVAPTLQTTGVTFIQLWEVSNVIYGARVGNA